MKTHLYNQKGSIAVLMAALLTVLLGFLGLVVDFGHAYLVKTKMQNAVDAAALGGASKLPASSEAVQQALNLVQANAAATAQRYYDPARAVASVVPFSDANYPDVSSCVTVTLSSDVPTHFLRVFNVLTIPVSVRADAIVTTSGSAGSGSSGGSSGGASPFDYVLYSAGNGTLGLVEPDQGQYHGSIYSGGNINFRDGGIKVNGDVVAKGSISFNGGKVVGNGTVSQGSTLNLALPDYKSAVSQLASTNGTVYTGPQSLTGDIGGNLYVQNGSLTIGNNPTTINGSTILMADGDININTGNVHVHPGSGPENKQLIIYSTNGDVKFNGGPSSSWSSFTVVVYAPHGTASVGGGGEQLTFNSVVARQISMEGGSTGFHHRNAINWPAAAGTSHVRLVR